MITEVWIKNHNMENHIVENRLFNTFNIPKGLKNSYFNAKVYLNPADLNWHLWSFFWENS